MNSAAPRQHDLNVGIIGNCVISALVDRYGRYVWSCFPRFDGDPIFCELLSGNQSADVSGFMDVEIDGFAASQQSYLGNSAILSTLLSDTLGQTVRVTDFAPRFKQYERVFRPQMLIRRIEPQAGACRVRVRIRPRFGYGSASPTVTIGSDHIRYGFGNSALRVTTDAPISHISEERWFVLDAPFTILLGADEIESNSVSELARVYLTRTEDYWVEWCRYLSIPFEWQDAVIRAAITLKLCSFEETGGIVAAMTTSIPEAPHSGRNWDYRYCWLRDAYFVVHALNQLGATRTMEDFIRYITDIAGLDQSGSLKPVYGIVPGPPLPEHIAPALSGYRAMGPVRIGNLAEAQVQNDSYGSVVLAATQMFLDRRLPRPGDQNLYHRLERLGQKAAEAAFEPDAGMWEYRGRTGIHTHSAVMCWAACDRLAKIAGLLGLADRRVHWGAEAQRIHRSICERSWNPSRNTFVSCPGGEHIDASLLLMPEVGFVSPTDPRFLGTLAAIEGQLRRGRRMFRYISADDYGIPVTAFTVCTFWYIDALAAVGRRTEAREIFEELLTRRNHLGLLSEDIDPLTGELWGNFPQTYSMVGLIISATRLSKSWKEAFWHGS